MRKIVFVSLLVGLAVLLSACGSSNSVPMMQGGAATSAPMMQGGNSTSAPMMQGNTAKDVNIIVTSNPSPAVTGDVELFLTIIDKSGNPIEAAKVEVGADHTDMSGMGMSGQATDQGGGKYSIKANFDESGNWRLTVKVKKDSLDYKEDIEFKVE